MVEFVIFDLNYPMLFVTAIYEAGERGNRLKQRRIPLSKSVLRLLTPIVSAGMTVGPADLVRPFAPRRSAYDN